MRQKGPRGRRVGGGREKIGMSVARLAIFVSQSWAIILEPNRRITSKLMAVVVELKKYARLLRVQLFLLRFPEFEFLRG